MASWRAPLGLAAISLIAGACSNFGLVGEDEQPVVGVSNLVDGGYLQPQSPILVQITAPPAGEDVLSIDISLLDAAGGLIWQSVLDAPPVNEPIEVGPFDELELNQGSFTLRFTVTTSASTAVEELTFFHVTGDYQLQALTAFPPVSAAGSTATLSATLAVPPGRDPLVRWWQSDQLIAEGMFSDGYDVASWPTPLEAGIYAISVELFPVPPPTARMVQPLPLATRDVSVYVVPADTAEPSDNHLVLYRFDATLADSAANAAATASGATATVLSGFAPLFGALGSDIGYVLDPDRQLDLSRSLFATGGDDGDSPPIAPFSLALSLRAADAAGVLLTSEGGGMHLVLAVDETRVPVATLTSGGSTASLAAGQPLGDDIGTLTLSVAPTAAGISLAWYQDGTQTAGAVDLPFVLSPTDAGGEPGRTTVGGPQFHATLGELGVYVRDDAGAATADPQAAYATLAREAGDGGWATGFDATVPAAPFADVRHAAGYAVIDGGQVLAVPLPGAATGFARVTFAGEAGAGEATVTVTGTADGDAVSLPLDGAAAIALTWRTDDDGVALSLALSDAAPLSETVEISLASTPTKMSLTAGADQRLLIDHLALSAAPTALPASE